MRDLAAALGVSAATVSAIENGQTAVTVDRLAGIAAALAVDPTDLLGAGGVSAEAPGRPRSCSSETLSSGRDWRRFPPLEVDSVMSSAIDCFVATGYHGATMRQIAAGARISVAGVYHHCRSKQELLVRIVDLTLDELDWRLAAACHSVADDPRGPLARLAAMVEALALFHTLRPELAFIGASEMRSLESPDRGRITRRRSAIQGLLDAEIAAAVAAGTARTARPREDGRAIATMCTSLPQWFDNTGPTTPEQIAQEYADLALRMVAAS